MRLFKRRAPRVRRVNGKDVEARIIDSEEGETVMLTMREGIALRKHLSEVTGARIDLIPEIDGMCYEGRSVKITH